MIAIKQEGLKTNIPEFRPGDAIRVHVKVVEGESERVQLFDGVVISRRGGGISETFTVRKTSFGVGIERIFPLHSPRVEKIEVLKHGKVRRAKLFYLRELSGKAARLSEQEKAKEETVAVQPSAEVAATAAQPASAPEVKKESVSENKTA